MYIHYTYNTHTVHIHYTYDTHTIHIQYTYNTHTVHIQYTRGNFFNLQEEAEVTAGAQKVSMVLVHFIHTTIKHVTVTCTLLIVDKLIGVECLGLRQSCHMTLVTNKEHFYS